jgi:DNA polymerase-4
MPLFKAVKQCRDAVVVDPNHELYACVSRRILERLLSFSPVVEPARFGHFFLDVSGTGRLFGHAVDCAAKINRTIAEDLSISASAGIARNKLVSSIAAKLIQPSVEICEVPTGSEPQFLAPLDVRLLPSVKKVEGTLVEDLNVRLVRELASITMDQLAHVFGSQGRELHRQARGIDESPVRPPKCEPSVFVEETLAEDTNDDETLLAVLYRLTEQGAEALREKGQIPRSLSLYLRYSDQYDVTRTVPLDSCSNLDGDLFRSVEHAFRKACTRRQRIRHVSIEFTKFLTAQTQMTIFAGQQRDRTRAVNNAVQSVRERFGCSAITVGRAL